MTEVFPNDRARCALNDEGTFLRDPIIERENDLRKYVLSSTIGTKKYLTPVG